MNPITFNEVAETVTSRMAFAQSVVSFLELYEFDGIDIDWESPLDRDKGGSPDNYERFVLLVEEIRSAIDRSGNEFLLTVALPGTEWELYDYDVIGMSEHVDWFNLMSFDYHTPKNIPKTVGAHSDLKLIDSVVHDLIKETAPTKFVLGMAAYGRTYTLADERCKELGCPFRSPGLGGCANTPGFIPYNEIHDFIESQSYDELHQDASSSSMVAVVDEDQMISFDDETTWAIKEAYAEMMCLRGTFLWSIDMLDPKSSYLEKDGIGGNNARSLSAMDTPSDQCTLCGDSKVHSNVIVDYNGEMVSCSNLDTLLNSVFVPRLSDQCLSIQSKFTSECCIHNTPKLCNICEPDNNEKLIESRRVSYAGSNTTCGDLSTSFHRSTKEFSFSCSVAKSTLASSCCAETCRMLCPNGEEMDANARVEYGGTQLSCADYELSIKSSGFLQGSSECDSSVSRFSNMCCSSAATVEDVPAQVPTHSVVPCNICKRDNIHHELKSEGLVEYKGATISCLDLNSILAKNELEQSEMCVATQMMLFDGCCYEKCSLCGEKSLRWDATVKYNNQILSCDELLPMFTLGTVREGSDQCDAMQMAYSSVCCYEPPKKKCALCENGSMPLEVNKHAFVKTQFSSSHCVNFVNDLAMTEEDDSEVCGNYKSSYSTVCCTPPSLPNAETSYYAADMESPSSDARYGFHIFFVWSWIMTLILFAM
mmetsp:Transcript_15620/g.26654  ORF Transcript_15620/g.26654 Transcript_15620/m.26654 type:complete len:707 (+) Transcript_15620:806-2926(+)